MAAISQAIGKRSYLLVRTAKKSRDKKSLMRTGESERFSQRKKELGRVHHAVFDETGARLIGFLIKRKDILYMIKQKDLFVALDGTRLEKGELIVHPDKKASGSAAIARLGVSWDACIIWQGMDVKDEAGKVLGHVSDVEFDEHNGRVQAFIIDDGKIASKLVGHLRIPYASTKGLDKQSLIVDAQKIQLELSGGLASTAGTNYAKAKVKGAEMREAIDQKIDEACASDAYSHAGKTIGRQLKRSRGMFSDFMDEFNKAQK